MFTKNLDTILSRLTSVQADLTAFEDQKLREVAAAEAEVDRLDAIVDEAAEQASRAVRINERLYELLS